MSQSVFKAAILDMDGVITQTATLHARAWKKMFDEYLQRRQKEAGRAFEPFHIDRDYRQYVDGKPRYAAVQSFLAARGIELPLGSEHDEPGAETICGLGNRKNAIFHQLLESKGIDVYEDALQQINNWKRDGLKVGVISSSRNCEAILKSANLLQLFDAKLDGNDLEPLALKGKPAPDVFLHMARRLGADPSEVIVVEDAVSGVQAARAGRFGLVVAVARDSQEEPLREAGADCVVHDLQQIASATQMSSAEPCLQTPSSATAHFDWIANRIGHQKLGLFLDYDGTLTPIVRRPEEATLAEEVRVLLSELAKQCTVAIISGRDRLDVQKMVGLENLVYAGSHGFDILGPGEIQFQQQEAEQALSELNEAQRKIEPQIEAIQGGRLERKKYAIAVHYREVERGDDVKRIERAVDEVLAQLPALRKRGGKKIFELQPDIAWDKGQAVLWLADALGLRDGGASIIYIGDDVTDEDAFAALRQARAGIGIRVAPRVSATQASYYLNDCDEVKEFLKRLLDFLRQT